MNEILTLLDVNAHLGVQDGDINLKFRAFWGFISHTHEITKDAKLPRI